MKTVIVLTAMLVVLGAPRMGAADHMSAGVIVAAGPAGVTMVEDGHRHVLVLVGTTKVFGDAGEAAPVARLRAGDYVREECTPLPDGRLIARRITVLRPAWRAIETPEY